MVSPEESDQTSLSSDRGSSSYSQPILPSSLVDLKPNKQVRILKLFNYL